MELAKTLMRVATLRQAQQDRPAVRECLQQAYDLCREMGVPQHIRHLEETAEAYGLALAK